MGRKSTWRRVCDCGDRPGFVVSMSLWRNYKVPILQNSQSVPSIVFFEVSGITGLLEISMFIITI